MTTSVDIPDELYRKAKIYAAENGLKLKEVISVALEGLLCTTQSSQASYPVIRKIPDMVFERGKGDPPRLLTNAEIDSLMWDKEDSTED